MGTWSRSSVSSFRAPFNIVIQNYETRAVVNTDFAQLFRCKKNCSIGIILDTFSAFAILGTAVNIAQESKF